MAMTDHEAHKVMRELRDAAIRDSGNLAVRIADTEKELEEEEGPNELTEAHIVLLRKRYARRTEEAEALSIAVSKF